MESGSNGATCPFCNKELTSTGTPRAVCPHCGSVSTPRHRGNILILTTQEITAAKLAYEAAVTEGRGDEFIKSERTCSRCDLPISLSVYRIPKGQRRNFHECEIHAHCLGANPIHVQVVATEDEPLKRHTYWREDDSPQPKPQGRW